MGNNDSWLNIPSASGPQQWVTNEDLTQNKKNQCNGRMPRQWGQETNIGEQLWVRVEMWPLTFHFWSFYALHRKCAPLYLKHQHSCMPRRSESTVHVSIERARSKILICYKTSHEVYVCVSTVRCHEDDDSYYFVELSWSRLKLCNNNAPEPSFESSNVAPVNIIAIRKPGMRTNAFYAKSGISFFFGILCAN